MIMSIYQLTSTFSNRVARAQCLLKPQNYFTLAVRCFHSCECLVLTIKSGKYVKTFAM